MKFEENMGLGTIRKIPWLPKHLEDSLIKEDLRRLERDTMPSHEGLRVNGRFVDKELLPDEFQSENHLRFKKASVPVEDMLLAGSNGRPLDEAMEAASEYSAFWDEDNDDEFDELGKKPMQSDEEFNEELHDRFYNYEHGSVHEDAYDDVASDARAYGDKEHETEQSVFDAKLDLPVGSGHAATEKEMRREGNFRRKKIDGEFNDDGSKRRKWVGSHPAQKPFREMAFRESIRKPSKEFSGNSRVKELKFEVNGVEIDVKRDGATRNFELSLLGLAGVSVISLGSDAKKARKLVDQSRKMAKQYGEKGLAYIYGDLYLQAAGGDDYMEKEDRLAA